ncbi:hypothetical protein COLO4_35596 [Corchorus olitorius]|uniref:Uncharacterized protein n=1 Tax=Corchorus olitorius TaxID=93759 RepID=A0A1R3GET2_9ROSI|nr:hypothetical protein COLO4_35596 [Corchorus olitorius]
MSSKRVPLADAVSGASSSRADTSPSTFSSSCV